MNEDLYDTGSTVVGLFTNFLKFFGESPGLDGSIGGGGGGGGFVLGITGPFPSYPHFSHFFQLKLFEITSLGGLHLKRGKKNRITLSAHNFFLIAL